MLHLICLLLPPYGNSYSALIARGFELCQVFQPPEMKRHGMKPKIDRRVSMQSIVPFVICTVFLDPRLHIEYSALFRNLRRGQLCSSLQDALGYVPRQCLLIRFSRTFHFLFFPDNLGFRVKRHHNATGCRALTEDVLRSLRSNFTTVYTYGSVNFVQRTAASAFFIPP